MPDDLRPSKIIKLSNMSSTSTPTEAVVPPVKKRLSLSTNLEKSGVKKLSLKPKRKLSYLLLQGSKLKLEIN